MTSIVERLRRYFPPPPQKTVAVEVRLIQDAADAIDLLSTAVVELIAEAENPWPTTTDIGRAVERALAERRRDDELLGMWEHADFFGGPPDEVRGPDWRPS